MLSPEEIGDLLTKGAMVEAALKAVRAHALKLMELGTEIPGWKRVAGEKHRAWKDEEAAAKVISSTFGVDPYVRKMRTPADMEDVLALQAQLHGDPKEIAEKYETITEKKMRLMNGRPSMAACKVVAGKAVGLAGAYKPEGEPTLAPASDERPALKPAFTHEEMDEVVKELDTPSLLD